MTLNIGFDAKRLFVNRSGLGNYSRSSVELLSRFFPEDSHTLFTPRDQNPLALSFSDNTKIVTPTSAMMKKIPSLWRSYLMASDIRRQEIDIYHGLSNELPSDILSAQCRSVVTMHDLIFVHFPQLYKPVDRYLYNKKYKSSCIKADRIIAISNQTRDDLVNVWDISPDKIDVVYQGCSSIFYDKCSETKYSEVKSKYNLPDEYILSVGSIEERKNLMLTLQAIVEGNIDMPLVACGKHTPYTDKLKEYAVANNIADRVTFLHNVIMADLPAIYQMARVSVYVSFYEGFGIPIIESLNSGTPMITSEGGVFPETGGDACLYVNQKDVSAMVDALNRAINDTTLREDMISKGHEYVKRFRDKEVATNLHAVYEKLL